MKKEGKSINISLRLEKDLDEEIERIAKKEERSKSQLVRLIMRDFIKNYRLDESLKEDGLGF